MHCSGISIVDLVPQQVYVQSLAPSTMQPWSLNFESQIKRETFWVKRSFYDT